MVSLKFLKANPVFAAEQRNVYRNVPKELLRSRAKCDFRESKVSLLRSLGVVVGRSSINIWSRWDRRTTAIKDNVRGTTLADLSDGLFLYIELFDFQIQRRPRDSEFGSRTIWPSNFSVAFRKSRFNEFLLIVVKVL